MPGARAIQGFWLSPQKGTCTSAANAGVAFNNARLPVDAITHRSLLITPSKIVAASVAECRRRLGNRPGPTYGPSKPAAPCTWETSRRRDRAILAL